MNIRRHAAVLAALFACCLTTAARAQSPEYSFVDINYSLIKPDKTLGLDDGNGIAVDGSYGLPANFTLVGGFGFAKYDFTNSSSGADEIVSGYNLGLGYHFPLTGSLDLVGEADYLGNHYTFQEPPFGDFSDNAHGTELSLGLRAMVTYDLELHGYLSRIHTNGSGSGGDSHGFKLGGIYNFASFFGLGLTYARDTSNGSFSSTTTNSYTLFARFQF